MKRALSGVVLVIMLLLGGRIMGQFRVGIMIPGEIGGNPIYELVESGATSSEDSGDIIVKVVEGGYNPSKWEPLLTSMVATRKYDLVMTFTEGLPGAVERIARDFPEQKLALIDGSLPISVPNVYSVAFKDEEMTFLAGVVAGLVTRWDLPGSNDELTVGFIAGDTYPAMQNRMLPGFKMGVETVTPDARVIFSIVGSWSDPSKARELAARQFEEGADIILEIAGGSGIGVIEEARNEARYVLNVDSNLVSLAPGVVLASSLKHIDKVVYDTISNASRGELEYGSNRRVGIADGVIELTFSDPDYVKHLPQEVREIAYSYYVLLKHSLVELQLE